MANLDFKSSSSHALSFHSADTRPLAGNLGDQMDIEMARSYAREVGRFGYLQIKNTCILKKKSP